MRVDAMIVLVALSVLLGERVASAERLFVETTDAPAADARVRRSRALTVDTGALGRLRAATSATVTDVPLGADGHVTLTVSALQPFTADARAEVVEAGGPRPLAFPDHRYFHGRVAGDPSSRVVLILGPTVAKATIATNGTIYRLGPDRGGTHRSWALRDADPAAFPATPALCGNDRLGALVHPPTGRSASPAPSTAGAPPTAAYAPTLLAEVAIETDQELRNKFSSDANALAYLTDLAAEVSAIYQADVDVKVKFRSIRLWNGSDPYSSSNPGVQLGEVRSYWNANEVGTPRDLVHFISGKSVSGGVAYLNVLCNPDYGYGVSQVYGSFDVMDPFDTWDVVVVAHELGHNFGSNHTHCYSPPVDHCYNGEGGCWGGAESLPPGGGTIMSYCHLLGGMSAVNLTFGATVSDVLRTRAENGMCIGLPCGDGAIDPGEACDDGNTVSGDCCSATCTAEPDGGTCSDGETCTTGDTCSGGACVGAPVPDGSPCTDGSQCTVDGCQAGACVGVPTPAASCKTPTAAGKSSLLLKHGSTNATDKLSWKWGSGGATTLGEFGDPIGTDDYELCVYEDGPSLLFSARVPAGDTCAGKPCWSLKTTGYGYKDKDRTPNGIDKLVLKAGAVGKAKATLRGKGDALALPPLTPITLPVTVQLRGAGQCWEATYGFPTLYDGSQFKAKSQ